MPARLFFGFSAAVLVFHQLPALLGAPASQAVDLLTPFAVVGCAAALLVSLGAARTPLVVGLVSAILYVDGHGIHLSANAIAGHDPQGAAREAAYFWDERFSHLELLVGWIGLVTAFALAERRRPADARPSLGLAAASAVVLGWTFFTSTVEGQTWWLLLPVAPAFAVWALRARRPIVMTAAASYVLAVALIGVWALVNRGVVEFSEVGLI